MRAAILISFISGLLLAGSATDYPKQGMDNKPRRVSCIGTLGSQCPRDTIEYDATENYKKTCYTTWQNH